jgi:hypothetical protein
VPVSARVSLSRCLAVVSRCRQCWYSLSWCDGGQGVMGVLKGPRRRRPLHVIAVKHATPRLQRAMRAMSLDDSRGRQWANTDASLLRQYRCREAVSLQMAGGSREKRRAAANSHPRPHAACPTNTANALQMRALMRLTPYGAQATEPTQTAGCSCLSRQLLEYVSLLPWWRARAACAAAPPSSRLPLAHSL